MNLTDFMQSDDSDLILVKGIGKVRLTQAKRRVQEMLNDLSNRVDNLVGEPGHDQTQWQVVDNLVKRIWMRLSKQQKSNINLPWWRNW